MDALGSYLTAEIIRSLGEGNFLKFTAYLAIFLILWLEIRGLKKSVKQLVASISQGFVKGEERFDRIEKKELEFEHRLTMLEQLKN